MKSLSEKSPTEDFYSILSECKSFTDKYGLAPFPETEEITIYHNPSQISREECENLFSAVITGIATLQSYNGKIDSHTVLDKEAHRKNSKNGNYTERRMKSDKLANKLGVTFEKYLDETGVDMENLSVPNE